MNSALRSLAPLAVASLVLVLGACAPEKPSADAAPAAGSDGAAAVAADDTGFVAIDGLPSKRAQASYMIGTEMAKTLEPLAEDIDVDLLVQGLADEMAGKSKLTAEQAQLIQAGFMVEMQTRAQARRAEQAQRNATEGPAFLAENKAKPGVHTTESGLQYRIERAGNGPKPGPADVVRIAYEGRLLDDTVFDSSEIQGGPQEMSPQGVIAGFAEALQLMPVGSKYVFWIPSELAYGENGGGPVPPNAVLRFEVELLEIAERH
ncbi:FKBP-type peptidyl-prolyl cis-trans isomerase [Arenimonas composti]|uniref:Peptidyl-prolyl cis-trans isomerase n=1 Tax=Arenimonas composti TR7-09 = DSM 18010 TaxID=1121013 RepID=A0A091BDX2_9GAMM|nr:FKBP-type peptidyl-prolyl cis-trans isomerase [Arenimonas composti]KFN50883.1 hypothetical protein P873_00615 [Arenimonas composti TR7-09 = DSM 18010]